MRAYLRLLGTVLLVGGLAMCAIGTVLTFGDQTFFNAGEALARHPDHVLFQGEYYAALARHVAYIVTAIIGGLLGIVGSAVLFGLYAILTRLEHVEAGAPSAR